ncbi:hypothetical protein SLA2020_133760 [Shorea laevis]
MPCIRSGNQFTSIFLARVISKEERSLGENGKGKVLMGLIWTMDWRKQNKPKETANNIIAPHKPIIWGGPGGIKKLGKAKGKAKRLHGACFSIHIYIPIPSLCGAYGRTACNGQ